MSDFESKMRNLALRTPSPALDERVLRGLQPSEGDPRRTPRQVPLGWAVAASLAIGFVGFISGLAWRDDHTYPGIQSPLPIRIEIIPNRSTVGHPFDLSQPPRHFLDGAVQVRVRVSPESQETEVERGV